MRILAFDTSGTGFSVALLQNHKIVAQAIVEENGKQAELLIKTIEEVLKKANLWYQDLDLIAASQGPGSFTGVRIGLAAARTLKIATNLPLILINSLEALSFPHRDFTGEIFTVIDAGIDEFFIATFSAQKTITEAQLVNLENIANLLPQTNFLICGSGKNIVAEIAAEKKLTYKVAENNAIDPTDLALMALEKYHAANFSNQNQEPLYLRNPKITQRKK